MSDIQAVELREQEFWNRRAADATRVGDIEYFGDITTTQDKKVINLHRHAVSLLGDLRGKRVLDCGCGYGALSAHLAKRGAEVTALDISPESIAATKEWFRRNGLEERAQAVVGSAHKLDFPDASFDAVVGSCILHHLDLALTLPEIRRVLKPGGKAVFIENNAANPILMFFRNRLLQPLGLRRGSDDESPMDEPRLALIRRAFPKTMFHFPEMVFLRFAASFFFNDSKLVRRSLERLDSALAALLPPLRPWSYYMVIEAVKEGA